MELLRVETWFCRNCFTMSGPLAGSPKDLEILGSKHGIIEKKRCARCGLLFNSDDALAKTVEGICTYIGKYGYRRDPGLRKSQDDHIETLERIKKEMARRDLELRKGAS